MLRILRIAFFKAYGQIFNQDLFYFSNMLELQSQVSPELL